MPDSATTPAPAAHRPASHRPAPQRKVNASPCRRCGGRDWDVEVRPKARMRWLLETLFAVPDVWIFQSESAGWPGKQFERWTCVKCRRRVRV